MCQLGVKSTFSDFCDRCAKDLPSRHKLRSVFTPDMRGTPKMGATRSNKGGALSSSQGGGGGNNTTGGTSAGASTATMGTMDVRDPLGIGDIFGSTNRSVISCFVLEYLLCSRMILLESSRYPTLKSALFESSVPFVESVAVWHELYSPNVMFPRHRSFPHLPTHFLARALCNPRTSISTMFIHHLPLVSIPYTCPYNTCPYTCPYTYIFASQYIVQVVQPLDVVRDRAKRGHTISSVDLARLAGASQGGGGGKDPDSLAPNTVGPPKLDASGKPLPDQTPPAISLTKLSHQELHLINRALTEVDPGRRFDILGHRGGRDIVSIPGGYAPDMHEKIHAAVKIQSILRRALAYIWFHALMKRYITVQVRVCVGGCMLYVSRVCGGGSVFSVSLSPSVSLCLSIFLLFSLQIFSHSPRSPPSLSLYANPTPIYSLCTPYVHPMYTNIPLYTPCIPFSETLCRPNGATPLRLLPHSPRRRHHDGRAGAGMVLATARGHCGEAGCCMGAAVCRALLGGKATASAKAVGGGATGRVCEGPVPASY